MLKTGYDCTIPGHCLTILLLKGVTFNGCSRLENNISVTKITSQSHKKHLSHLIIIIIIIIIVSLLYEDNIFSTTTNLTYGPR